MSPRAVVRRWVVDGIEEGVARIEEEGKAVIMVPAWLLPAGVREGQVLRVTCTGTARLATTVVEVDEEATDAALARSREQVERIARASRARDPGGDVAL